MTTKRHKPTARFAICVKTNDPDLLTPRMIYQILPDESAAKSNYLRVIDNEGEDYLYPAKHFMLVDFPQPVERVLLRTRIPRIRPVPVKRSRSTTAQRKNP